MDEEEADQLWRSWKGTDTAAKRGHGLGFDSDFEQQHQDALARAYPVSSGAERGADRSAAALDGYNLHQRFHKASATAAEEPDYSQMSATERIKARVKHAAAKRTAASKQAGEPHDFVVGLLRRVLL